MANTTVGEANSTVFVANPVVGEANTVVFVTNSIVGKANTAVFVTSTLANNGISAIKTLKIAIFTLVPLVSGQNETGVGTALAQRQAVENLHHRRQRRRPGRRQRHRADCRALINQIQIRKRPLETEAAFLFQLL
jgi:hypothetical protein